MVVKAIEAMVDLTELDLIPRTGVLDFLRETVSFLCHPNLWIRLVSVFGKTCVKVYLNYDLH